VTAAQCSDLCGATVAPGDPNRGSAEENFGSSKLADAGSFRVYGAGSYGFAMVASGKLDIAIDFGLDPFDFAAPVAIVEGIESKVYRNIQLARCNHGETVATSAIDPERPCIGQFRRSKIFFSAAPVRITGCYGRST
jgi:fructose-1,6-bisphosphatase/inositol monophosphatase family enzyme